MSTNNRITFVVGAGAPLDLSLPENVIWPSTGNITSEVLKPYDNYLDSKNPINIVQDIYDVLFKTFPTGHTNPCEPEPDGPSINFEQLFHVLEMLGSYSDVWERRCSAPNLFPVFAPFTLPSVSLDCQHIHSVLKQFILRIMEIVNAYNQYVALVPSENQWYRDFYASFREDSDFYIFNYDTTIEDSIGTYEDGFEPDGIQDQFKCFNPKRLFNYNERPATINHLHGCINFYESTYSDANQDVYTFLSHDLYKYPSFQDVKKLMIGRSSGDPASQSGETYHASPIITGLRKTDKLNCIPFDFYHGNMYKSIIENSRLVVIGYSFGDLYCNQLIERLHYIHKERRRIVLIDFWNIPEEHRKMYGGYYLNNNLGMFICRAMEVGDFHNAVAELYSNEDKNTGALYSNNGCLMVLPHGFRNAAATYGDIIKFLNS